MMKAFQWRLILKKIINQIAIITITSQRSRQMSKIYFIRTDLEAVECGCVGYGWGD